MDAGIFRDLEKDKKFSYAFGLEMVGASRFTSKFFIQQAYVDLRYRGMEISVGSKERGNEMKNDQLSSGSMTFSTNSRRFGFQFPNIYLFHGPNIGCI